MTLKPDEHLVFRPDPHRKHPPIDIAALEADPTVRRAPRSKRRSRPKDVQLPIQVRHAAAVADA
jgi:hypothetical protein